MNQNRHTPSDNPRARDWWATADHGLRRLIEDLTWHRDVKWAVPDYVDDVAWAVDDRRETDRLDETEALSSELVGVNPWDEPDDPKHHTLLLDLDVPAWLVPSSTSGHGHLYVDLRYVTGGGIDPEHLFEFLRAAAKIGLIEEGYANACIERGMTSVRAPWVRKGHEEDDADARDHDVTPDDWRAPVIGLRGPEAQPLDGDFL